MAEVTGSMGGGRSTRRGEVPEPRWVVRATTTLAQVAACAEGHGIALLGTFVGPREPRLLPIMPAVRPPPRDAWLVVHEAVRKRARVAAVMDWLARLDLGR